MSKPRIAICGIHIESSTFTPYISTEADFQVTRGKNLLARYAWMDQSWARQVEWLPVLHAPALPGGVVERTAYESWKTEIAAGLEGLAPLDGIFFDIHGAMSVEGMDDAEGDLIKAIRDAVGEEPIVSASMDLHGNVSMDLFEGCDLLTCYRMAPHEDALESRERAARNLVERIVSGAGKPAKALVHVPVLLPGEKTSTRIEPAKSLYAMIPPIEARTGILDAAIWIGFAWADQPRCKGAVVVTGDDSEDVAAQASALASILGPDAVAACAVAGVGNTVSAPVGGNIDSRDPGPVPVTGTVRRIIDDPRGGLTAVITTGGLDLIVTSKRNQYAELEQYLALGLDPRDADVVVVKIGYLEPDLYDAQRGWMMALTPGGVDQDLERLGHTKINRPMFPFDDFTVEPDLRPLLTLTRSTAAPQE